ncbi:phosphoribosylformylglycinamidine synthase [Haloimpatiens massiliensis]|uniref:phosphoribosylformylglycinamidine synthase n=1 Tax=Haloimpatiens massiliensis TaxID=1658110 RepID=UPI000C814C76|nr:phosphoribosylformylglycinamidine synthase [Haloimpatiens massiliensis]
MINEVFRIYVEKKKGFDDEAKKLLKNINNDLNLKEVEDLRILNRYDICGIDRQQLKKSISTVFSEPPVDNVYEEEINIENGSKVFGIQYLDGQYDQRADSAAQCVQLIAEGERPIVKTAKIIVIEGNIAEEDFNRIKGYCINPVDSCEAKLEKPSSLEMQVTEPKNIEIVEKFIDMKEKELENLIEKLGLAMNLDDMLCCQKYFLSEKRNPTLTEIKVLDTYWSDHCRHTTFNTIIKNVEIKDGKYKDILEETFEEYKKSREFLYKGKNKEMCLMDIACIVAKELRKRGMLDDLEVSEEINACSVEIDVDVDGKDEKWLLMFKNETHNHPTEIEPFGGAATCLGGAIRDPLSGRAYVYQAMRVTGSGDPTVPISNTLSSKLPQRKITTEAANGYSSYGNQIGLSTGQVTEVYHEDFRAKRMEVGAVIAAAPKKNVKRLEPEEGDVIILLGGRTGRDGCGGATGSSKEHDENSIYTCGAEVQKGNPVEERKIQRLFRKEEVASLIKRCNDFGAGGVSVAIGELADGLYIDLDKVPKKYEGLDGTELSISESQERMAVVISKEHQDKFINYAEKENIEAVVVAKVTSNNRLTMNWRGQNIVDIDRDFLNSNGASRYTDIVVNEPEESGFLDNFNCDLYKDLSLEDAWIKNLENLNVCSQRGLVEKFDSTIGAGTVLMPLGGKYQSTPVEAMVAKIPVLKGETETASIMSFGYNPYIAKWSPFHGAVYASLEAITKVVVTGGEYNKIRLTLQEYFEKLGEDKEKWGKPFSALLGALYVQKKLNIPAIGGKDSMSGSFKDLNVPPTLVTFAVGTSKINNIVSAEFKKAGSKVIILDLPIDHKDMPNLEILKENYNIVTRLINKDSVLAASSVKFGGISEAISKMCFGNKVGFKFNENIDREELFKFKYGSIILELKDDRVLEGLNSERYRVLGNTIEEEKIEIEETHIDLPEAVKAWEETLEKVFPTKTEKTEDISGKIEEILYKEGRKDTLDKTIYLGKDIKPTVLVPAFPGTNCEYDSQRAFEKAGANVETFVFRNLTPAYIKESVQELSKAIDNSQIIMLPGGFSAGDEPDGSGKFIANIFRNPLVKESVMNLIKNRDGLMLGICNGFQVLIKLGLVPFGEIKDIDKECPTLTYNKIGRHMSRIVSTKVVSNLSPWFSNVNVGDIHSIPVSHGEGRIVIKEDLAKKLFENGQVATQYVDFNGNPTYDIEFNPNGSSYAIEGITSPDGRILGKMGHSERRGNGVIKNILGEKDQKIFKAGVEYFK